MPRLTKLVTTIKLQERHLERLRAEFPDVEFVVCTERDRLPEVLPDAQALIGGGLTAELMRRFPEIRWTQAPGAGVDGMLFPELVESNDVILTNNSGVHASNIAEHLLGMMLAHARALPELMRNQVNREWKHSERGVFELGYQTLAIAGLGDIGHALAIRAKGLGMRVLGSRRRVAGPMEGVDRVYGPDEWRDMLPEADHVAITLPLTPRTQGLFGEAEFKMMKSTAYIYNIGRGEIIDQDALIEALRSGQIGGAGLDVTTPEPLPSDSPLWDLPNVLITPHMSGATPHYWDRGIEILVENVRRFRAGEPLINVVDKREGY
jgi:D-2-hydroxyacid dehydrogenase (NADP+)